jgi:hypothetical protein
MRKVVVFAALAGLSLTVAGLGLNQPEPAFGTTLDGFAINTEDKAVTVTLYTDQRAQYTTETQGRQFAIVLPNTQLSPEQMNNGLPVVIDNKNRFIGRAVPTEDGKVKIILPNLPASEYAVSVQQKRAGQASATPAGVTKPHTAVNLKAESHFEKVAESFPKPAMAAKPSFQPTGNSRNSSESTAIRLSSGPSRSATAAPSQSGTVWNPYVIKAPSVPQISESSYSRYKPVYRHKTRYTPPQPVPQQAPVATREEPVNIFSLMDSQPQTAQAPFIAQPPAFGAPANPPANSPKDPLWFLHSLPPANPGQMPADDLKGLAQESPFIPTVALAKAESSPQPSGKSETGHSALRELKDSILGLPHWLLLTLSLFLGGMGVFTLIGGLVLLRILFAQSKPNIQPTFILSPGAQFVPVDVNGQPMMELFKSGYVTEPPRPAFKDTTTINALDYLKDSPNNIPKAVQNSVLLKFPSRNRQRLGSRSTVGSRRTGTGSTIPFKR